MYGSAASRDRRRQGAILRLEANVVRWQTALERQMHVAKASDVSEEAKKSANQGVEAYRRKLHTAQRDLANTKANLGKGTSAMKKVKA